MSRIVYIIYLNASVICHLNICYRYLSLLALVWMCEKRIYIDISDWYVQTKFGIKMFLSLYIHWQARLDGMFNCSLLSLPCTSFSPILITKKKIIWYDCCSYLETCRTHWVTSLSNMLYFWGVQIYLDSTKVIAVWIFNISNQDGLICVWLFLDKNDCRSIKKKLIAYLYLCIQNDLMFSGMKIGSGCWRPTSRLLFFWLYHLLHACLFFYLFSFCLGG